MELASFSMIYGLSLGVEWVDAMPEEDIPNSIVLDLFIFRIIFSIE